MSEIRIQDIVERMNLNKPVVVNPQTKLKQALDIMSGKNYSQLRARALAS